MLQIKKLGVVIVLIALVTSLFLGVLTNTTSSTETVTEYEYVADMSQTFNYSNLPDYTEYNPIANYSGYVRSDNRSSGVGFTAATGASNYRMANEITSTTDTQTIDSLVTTDTVHADSRLIYLVDNPDVNHYTSVFNEKPYFKQLSDVIDAVVLTAPAGTTQIHIGVQSGSSDPTYGIDYNLVAYIDSSPFYEVNLGERLVYGSDEIIGPLIPNYATSSGFGEILYDMQTSTTKIPDTNGNYYSVNPQNVYMVWKNPSYAVKERILTLPATVSEPTLSGTWTTNLYLTYDTITYSFMKVNDGVYINNTDNTLTTDWSNGEDNGIVDIVFGKNPNVSDMSNTFTLVYQNPSDNRSVAVSRTGAASNELTVGGVTYNLGIWDYFLIRFNAMEGTVTAYPVTSFTNYTQFTISETALATGTIPTGIIDSISWDAVTSDGDGDPESYYFTVSDTTVFATSRLLMVNPSIDINDYFNNADNEGWRLNFYSFVTQGSSMTINGTTYPVEDGKITIDSQSFRLNNVYVSYDTLTDHVSITFVNDRYTVDLGQWTSSVISFTGTWFFNTAYYEADITTQTDTSIQWTKLPPMGTVSLFFIAITLILMAVGIKKIGFGMTDYIVTLVSLAVALCFLEAFI